MSVDIKARAVINVKYDEMVLDVIKKLSLSYAVLNRLQKNRGNEDELIEFAKCAIRDRGGWIDVVIDEGGFAIEPNAYFFEESATKLADRIIRVSRLYAKGRLSGKATNGMIIISRMHSNRGVALAGKPTSAG